MKKSMLSTKQSYLMCAVGIVVLFGILMGVCESGMASTYIKGIMMTSCIAIIMTTSLNLTIGVLGQLTLGCCGFEAIGAYSAALLSKLGFSVATLVACVLLINGVPDAAADSRVGKRTLAVRLGARGAAALYLWLVLLAHGWLALSVWLLIPPLTALWGLLSLPLSLAAAWQLLRHGRMPQRLRPAIGLSIAAANLHALALAAGLALGR